MPPTTRMIGKLNIMIKTIFEYPYFALSLFEKQNFNRFNWNIMNKICKSVHVIMTIWAMKKQICWNCTKNFEISYNRHNVIVPIEQMRNDKGNNFQDTSRCFLISWIKILNTKQRWSGANPLIHAFKLSSTNWSMYCIDRRNKMKVLILDCDYNLTGGTIAQLRPPTVNIFPYRNESQSMMVKWEKLKNRNSVGMFVRLSATLLFVGINAQPTNDLIKFTRIDMNISCAQYSGYLNASTGHYLQFRNILYSFFTKSLSVWFINISIHTAIVC